MNNTAVNEHTNKAIRTGVNSDAYRNNPFWDNIKKQKQTEEKPACDEKDSNQKLQITCSFSQAGACVGCDIAPG